MLTARSTSLLRSCLSLDLLADNESNTQIYRRRKSTCNSSQCFAWSSNNGMSTWDGGSYQHLIDHYLWRTNIIWQRRMYDHTYETLLDICFGKAAGSMYPTAANLAWVCHISRDVNNNTSNQSKSIMNISGQRETSSHYNLRAHESRQKSICRTS